MLMHRIVGVGLLLSPCSVLGAACVQGEDVPLETEIEVEPEDLDAPMTDEAVGRGNCRNACDAGTRVVEKFCRKLPEKEKKWREGCWKAANESNGECKRFC